MHAGGAQQPQLAKRRLARADDNDDARSSIEKDRKEAQRGTHALTSIIFHIIVGLARQIEKYYGEIRKR
jgi:hypothetical protein